MADKTAQQMRLLQNRSNAQDRDSKSAAKTQEERLTIIETQVVPDGGDDLVTRLANLSSRLDTLEALP